MTRYVMNVSIYIIQYTYFTAHQVLLSNYFSFFFYLFIRLFLEYMLWVLLLQQNKTNKNRIANANDENGMTVIDIPMR